LPSFDNQHPDYRDRIDEWRIMRDTSRGAKAVKKRQGDYLPKPSGFNAQPDGGTAAYSAYLLRAQFPGIVRPTIRGMVGVIHRMEAQIELPTALEPLRQKATKQGLSLEGLHRYITTELLTMGRFGLLADAEPQGSELPFLAGYWAEAIINWDEDSNDFFVLDESGLVRNGYEWVETPKFRALEFKGGRYQVTVEESGKTDQIFHPTARGGRALEEVPFTIIGATDVVNEPDDPPLIGVANAALAAYRLDADYRHQMYMSGQDTLFISGIDKTELPPYVGAGVVIALPENARAEYVGPNGTGIDAHEKAIDKELDRAASEGARMFDSISKNAESGEALRLRYGAQTATLTSVAKAGAAGLQKALRHVAMFMGADPEQVLVKPNLKFVDTTLTPADAVSLVSLWQQRGISRTTMFENLQRGEIISSERTQEEEFAEIEADTSLDDPEFEEEVIEQ
jgi:hypothetical protein